MRPIDADALKKEKTYLWDEVLGHTACVLVEDIDAAPTIYAVEVVRCRDCKWWMHMEEGMGDCTNRRFHLDGHADPSMKADDFCSCAERRDDDAAD